MVRLAEGLVGVDLRDFFTRREHLLETEQVTVNTLPVSGPRRVLDVSSYGPLEQCGAVDVLVKLRKQDLLGQDATLTVSLGSNIASAHALLSLLALLITSVLPSWYFLV